MAATRCDESRAGPSFSFHRDFAFPHPSPSSSCSGGGLLPAAAFVGALGCPLGMLCFGGASEKFDRGGGLNPKFSQGIGKLDTEIGEQDRIWGGLLVGMGCTSDLRCCHQTVSEP